jgi:hypothetical protein
MRKALQQIKLGARSDENYMVPKVEAAVAAISERVRGWSKLRCRDATVKQQQSAATIMHN